MDKLIKDEIIPEIMDRLETMHPEAACALDFGTHFQLLSAVMLSAQCKDERVNMVTAELFALAPTAGTMAELPVETIEKIIHPCGLANNKSRNLSAAAKILAAEYAGVVPKNMQELTALPGIGRKSANVILGNAFGIPGFPVDTHVRRLLNRIGTVKSDSPEKIEADVNAHVQPELWCNFSHLLITHGRKVCSARNPQCAGCTLKNICQYGEKR
jgi:endonuclease-3